jgi:serine/threonine protein kinase
MSNIDDLLDRWEELRECGKHISAEELCRDQPEMLPELRRQIKALEAVSMQFGSAGFNGDDESGEPAWSPASHFEMLNRFEILSLHASGGLGHVYLAHDKVLDRPVAIKFLKRADLSKEQLERFEWEARITGRLEHPGIVPIHSMRESDGSTPCYVMRFINGKTFQQTVQEFHAATAKLSQQEFAAHTELRRLLQTVASVCNIVSYAHSRGIIHRDIKPSNIMLGPFGEVLLLDWGIAKPKDEGSLTKATPAALITSETPNQALCHLNSLDSPAFTSTGQAIGTPAYASPEQLLGKESSTNPASDVFSLGATLFYLLAGKSPAEAVGWSTYLAQCKLPYTDLTVHLPKSIPKKLQAICHRAIQTRVEGRYQTAMELASDIDCYLAREPISVIAETWRERTARIARKHPAWTSGMIATAMALFLAAMISSIIINSKNSLLTKSEESLRTSLSETQLANDQAMTAMRTMFDGIVLSHFSEKAELNREDREYLQKSLEQYYAFANMSRDDRRSRAVKAEANYNVAHMLNWLSQPSDAIPKAKEAVKLYGDLYRESGHSEYITEFLEAIRLLSEMQARYENSDEAIRVAREGIAEVDRLFREQTTIDSVFYYDQRSSFYSNVATGFIQKRDWANAFDACQLAIADAENFLSLQPSELKAMHGLASELGRAAELSLHSELEINSESGMAFANRSIELRQKLLDAEPDIAMSQANWARAHYARALCYADDGQTDAALDDVQVAITYVDRLRIRYPLIGPWNNAVVEYRTLAARQKRVADDWPGVIAEIKQGRDLKLSVDALTAFIDLLTEYRVVFPDHPVATEWLAELHSRRAALIGVDDIAQNQRDCELAVKLRRVCVEDSPESAVQCKELIKALVAMANIQSVNGDKLRAIETVQQARTEIENSTLLDVDSQSFFRSQLNDLEKALMPN